MLIFPQFTVSLAVRLLIFKRSSINVSNEADHHPSKCSDLHTPLRLSSCWSDLVSPLSWKVDSSEPLTKYYSNKQQLCCIDNSWVCPDSLPLRFRHIVCFLPFLCRMVPSRLAALLSTLKLMRERRVTPVRTGVERTILYLNLDSVVCSLTNKSYFKGDSM